MVATRREAQPTVMGQVTLPQQIKQKRGFTEGLGTDEHKALARFFTAARRGRESNQEPRCREILIRILRDLSERENDDRVDL